MTPALPREEGERVAAHPADADRHDAGQPAAVRRLERLDRVLAAVG
ncbi:MAG: hypothetical protein R2699_16365 [Acidimicrobiales bacterium]